MGLIRLYKQYLESRVLYAICRLHNLVDTMKRVHDWLYKTITMNSQQYISWHTSFSQIPISICKKIGDIFYLGTND